MEKRKTRVRFAPSPTGPLHMGGVRTALYNYLYAKQRGGDFILRIEDTDSNRFVPGAEEYIIRSLAWCGILPDEGVDAQGKVVETASPQHPHAPYRQSQRKGLYRKYAEQLIASGNAYYAFDTAEELDARRAEAEAKGETFIYNQQSRLTLRNSLTLSPEETARLLAERTDWTIRFKMPENETVAMDDLIRGHVEVNSSTLDDKVLWKRADELPTYHLANIVDDHLMEITEVIRGEEWLPSLPLHYLLYRAFGWTETQPRFAHLPLLLKPVGNGKLSKRDGDKMGFPVFPLEWTAPDGTVSHGYREDGYFPEAFINMLAMLGWNPGTEQELFSLEELTAAFSIDKVSKSGAKFNPEKARWYNKEYLRMKDDDSLTELLVPVLESHGLQVVDCAKCALTAGLDITPEGADFKNGVFTRDYVRKVVSLVRERVTFVKDFWTVASCLFIAPERYAAYNIVAGATAEPKAADPRRAPDPRAKVWDDTLTAPFLAKDVDKFWKGEAVRQATEVIREATGDAIEERIREAGWPVGKVMNALRLALTGAASGLGIGDITRLIGRAESVARTQYALKRLGNGEEQA